MTLRRKFILAIFFLAIVGIFDAGYLTIEHYSRAIPPCSNSVWVDCGRVLKSQYAMIGGLPVAVLGLAFYSTMVGLIWVRYSIEKDIGIKDVLWRIVERYARPKSFTLEKMLFFAQVALSVSAVLFSVYFVWLQLSVIHAICLYCMVSAILSFSIFGVSLGEYVVVQKNTL